jgi:hypothetical protein
MKIKSLVVISGFMLPCLAAAIYVQKQKNVSPTEITQKETELPHLEGIHVEQFSCCKKPEQVKSCVFKTLMGEESSDSGFVHKTPEKSLTALKGGLSWLVSAQHNDGGWSSEESAFGGSNSDSRKKGRNKDKMDYTEGYRNLNKADAPQEMEADPASTAMACMALLRCGNTFTSGQYQGQLKKGLEYLLHAVESHTQNQNTITSLTNTQPQRKLGSNIDVVLTAQCLSNILHYLPNQDVQEKRIRQCLEICVKKIQQNQASDGSFKGNGWAGVLQSAFANNALEAADAQGITVDAEVLKRSRDYQKGNYDVNSGNAKTDMGAGVMLYSLSSSGRAAAAEARDAKKEINKAKKAGKLKETDDITVDNLRKAGLDESDAMKYSTAYQVNSAASARAGSEEIMTGYGNNGGEEFLSFLQTGEGLVIAKDDTWQKWYDNVSGKLINIQNQDGSWNGHHCITSPVFCTATCLLVMSIHNEVDFLQK